ncbi:AI-2E family transporter [Dehalogenimonas sp. 4OHTPN]|uniref:AI-2E family transporter n=1 Tax=Dehalogenimonas sp. 4OHTPN TaxID=3166643 RepID=A0AAU8G6U4_9CHLR
MQSLHLTSRHWRSIVFVAILVVFFSIAYTLRSVLLPFFIGVLVAFILHPAVVWLESHVTFPEKLRRHRRVILVVIVLLLLAALIVLVASYMIAILINTVDQLLDNASEIVDAVMSYFSNLLESVRTQFSPDIQARIDQFVTDVTGNIGTALENLARRSFDLIPDTIGVIFGFAALPMFLFYLLKDWEKLGNALHNNLPRQAAIHTRNVLTIIGGVLGRYLRAQLLLGSIVGSVTFIGLLLMRVNFGLALLLALIAGVFEMVPTIGPWISGLFALIIILATYPDLVIWVIGLFLFVQLMENNLLVPRIQGQLLHIHPAVALLLLVLGAYTAGIWGILLAVPLTATIVQIFYYLNDASRLEDHLPLLHHDATIFQK